MVCGSRFKEHFEYYDIHVPQTTTKTTPIIRMAQQPSTVTKRSSLRRKSSNRTGVCTLKRSPHVKKRQFSRSPSVVYPMSRSPSFQQRVKSNNANKNVAAVVYYRVSSTSATTTTAPAGKNVSTISSGRTKFVDWCLKQKAKLLHHNNNTSRR
ncbi:hypothetical protein BDC45DRAFT_496577 [Circinella umbellata]|nr:hypothetical protein BDC45DRAFT_496577 [Circinella umbellata]